MAKNWNTVEDQGNQNKVQHRSAVAVKLSCQYCDEPIDHIIRFTLHFQVGWRRPKMVQLRLCSECLNALHDATKENLFDR